MSHVQIFQTPDGGDIRVVGGSIVTDNGVASAFYLAMFGGDMDDDGSASSDARQWWGNFIEDDPTRRYRSQTQAILRSIPATTSNLRKVEDAVSADLTWAVDTGLAAYAVARARMPKLNTAQIDVFTEINNEALTVSFPPMPWGLSGS